jgi:hypothetical protein
VDGSGRLVPILEMRGIGNYLPQRLKPDGFVCLPQA